MSQQYYYNNSQYTTPTSYAGQSANACYAAALAQPLTTGYTTVTAGRTTLDTSYNVSGSPMSSAHRSQAPVTYTYPANATVMTPTLGVIPSQQAALVASSLAAGKVVSTLPGFVIGNGPTSAQTSLTNNGAYTVTTSYFQQLPGQTQIQQQNIAQAAVVAAAQQANFQAAIVAASNTRGRNLKTTPRSSIDSQVFYCEVCKISCAGPQTYKEHLDGQKHKKKATGNNVVLSTATSSNQRQLRCELCDVTCTGVDAYQAHIRGSKHQKTFKLHQRLGKPIPCSDPLVVKAVSVTGAETNDELASTATVKIVAGPKINFISSSNLKSVVNDGSVVEKIVCRGQVAGETVRLEEHIDLTTLQDKSLTPIGNEYIETTFNETGKVIQFFCKLCSCKFNDPHAKEMHLKGRRHRLQYKKKVDPSLVVDGKIGTSRNSKIIDDRIKQKQQREEYWRRRDMQVRLREMQRLEYSNIPSLNYPNKGLRSFDTLDDKYVMTKHANIYPTEEELQTIHSIVIGCEKALRQISELLFDDTNKVDIISSKDDVKKEDTTKVNGEKLLSGVMRVGPLAKSLLLRGEMVVSLVLLCSKWPTFSLMEKVVEKLPDKLQELLPNEKVEVTLNSGYQCILVSRNKGPEMHCYIHFTSSIIREESKDGAVAVQPEDGLDRKRCLDALASLRHTKWFQAKVSNLHPCLTLIRILRDLCQRTPTWTPLSSWAVELLVEKVVSSDAMKLSLGSALRRFFECVASGVLLPCGPGLRDPCEKELSDASAVLSAQDREDITFTAQHALRLIAFRQIHVLLDMEPLTSTPSSGSTPVAAAADSTRKRVHGDEDGSESESLKRERKENGDKLSQPINVATSNTHS